MAVVRSTAESIACICKIRKACMEKGKQNVRQLPLLDLQTFIGANFRFHSENSRKKLGRLKESCRERDFFSEAKEKSSA